MGRVGDYELARAQQNLPCMRPLFRCAWIMEMQGREGRKEFSELFYCCAWEMRARSRSISKHDHPPHLPAQGLALKWPAEKRHKYYSESECGNYMVSRDRDGVLCGWRRGMVARSCRVIGCGRFRTPCGKAECDIPMEPGWIGVGCSKDWEEVRGLLEGTLAPKDVKHMVSMPCPWRTPNGVGLTSKE